MDLNTLQKYVGSDDGISRCAIKSDASNVCLVFRFDYPPKHYMTYHCATLHRNFVWKIFKLKEVLRSDIKFLLYPCKRSLGVYRNLPVCLSVCSSVCLSRVKSTLAMTDKAFIIQLCVPCDKTFLSVPKFLTLWPLPWLLTYFWKNWTLAKTFEAKEIMLSYYWYIFFVRRPFSRYQNFWPCDLDLEFWPTFEQT